MLAPFPYSNMALPVCVIEALPANSAIGPGHKQTPGSLASSAWIIKRMQNKFGRS